MPKFNFTVMMAKAGAGEDVVNPTPPPTTTAAETVPVEESAILEASQPQPSELALKKRRLVKLGSKIAANKKTRSQLLEAINDGSSGSSTNLGPTDLDLGIESSP